MWEPAQVHVWGAGMGVWVCRGLQQPGGLEGPGSVGSPGLAPAPPGHVPSGPSRRALPPGPAAVPREEHGAAAGSLPGAVPWACCPCAPGPGTSPRSHSAAAPPPCPLSPTCAAPAQRGPGGARLSWRRGQPWLTAGRGNQRLALQTRPSRGILQGRAR